MNMKKGFIGCVVLLFATTSIAQTEVTSGVMRGKDYGVTYILPKSEIKITITATKHTYKPGEFSKYANHYLRLSNIPSTQQEYWTLNNVQAEVIGIPDKSKTYFVKLKDKTVAPLMELTEDGIVKSINMPKENNIVQKEQPSITTENAKKKLNPRDFLTEEILMANSSAKMAELIAKEIYAIRESKNALLRGEADYMPKDGEQLKIMIEHLTLQEEALTEMFAGSIKCATETFTIRLIPKEIENEVVFRFSSKLGVVNKDNLAGEPYFISITNMHTPQIPTTTEEKKKELEGVVYNVPGRANITLTNGSKTLYNAEHPITQFGITEFLAPVLFNKNSVIKVLFDTKTGGLLKVDRGE